MLTIFKPGDNLVFQLESGFGIMRIIAVEEQDGEPVWHVSVFEDFYADVEFAETALGSGAKLPLRAEHIALTNYAFEKTEAARLNNTPVRDEELAACHRWQGSGAEPSHRSVRHMLGFR